MEAAPTRGRDRRHGEKPARVRNRQRRVALVQCLYEAGAARTIVDGLFGRRFAHLRSGRGIQEGIMANKGTCKAKDCSREVVGKGYCRQHFRLWKAGEMPKARYKTCTFEKCRKQRH